MRTEIIMTDGRRIKLPKIVADVANVAKLSLMHELPDSVVMRPLTIEQAREIREFIRLVLFANGFTTADLPIEFQAGKK